jgi:hypothetical protein
VLQLEVELVVAAEQPEGLQIALEAEVLVDTLF